MAKGRISYDNKGDLRYIGKFRMNALFNATSWNNDLAYNDTWLNGICEGCEATMDMSINQTT